MRPEIESAHRETLHAWEENAAYWDSYMGDGNDFVEVLIWPATRRLLDVQAGQQILDVACGNGLYARRLAALGADVVAFDFSPEMVERARAREDAQARARERAREDAREHAWRQARVQGPQQDREQAALRAGDTEYMVLDATDEQALLSLGVGRFDAAMCAMALFDMSEIAVLMRALARLLRPGGRFVFSVMHPCFNTPLTTHVAEMQERDGEVQTVHSVKISQYMTQTHTRALALRGQPKPQIIFHRPLHVLLGAAFEAGFVVSALEERAFPADHPPGRNPLAWGGAFAEIPPVLIVQCRLPE